MDGIETELDRDAAIALVSELRRQVARLRAESGQLQADNEQLGAVNEQFPERSTR